MSTLVPDWGSREAGLLLVGEAPGHDEVEQLKPFVGASGRELERWWQIAGLMREEFYITNVYPFQPPGNKIASVKKGEIEHWTEQLHNKITGLVNVKLIVVCGATALKALTGRADISNWRGSPMVYEDRSGRKIDLVPTLHPAAVLRDKSMEFRTICDWQKIAYYRRLPEIPRPHREFIILDTPEKLSTLANVVDYSKPVSIDIETHSDEGITCVGFAQSAEVAYSIPLGVKQTTTKKRTRTKEDRDKDDKAIHQRVSAAVYHEDRPLEGMLTKKGDFTAVENFKKRGKVYKKLKKLVEEWEEKNEIKSGKWPDEEKQAFFTKGFWRTQMEAQYAMDWVKWLCESKMPKIMQNGFYDYYWLYHYGIEVNNYAWDTLAMHHLLYPNDQHSLDYMASLFTNETFWKKEVKEATTSGTAITRRDALYSYNAKDCAVTYELFEILYSRLAKLNKLEFFHYHYRNMFEPLLSMMLTGIPVDAEQMKKRRKELQEELSEKLVEVEQIAGRSLAGKTNLSSTKVADYLYNDLKLPKQMRKRQKGERTPSGDEIAVRTLMIRKPREMEKIGPLILRCRRLGKLIGALKETVLDQDNRFRSTYKFTTETGRLASAKNPMGTGGNAQNIDRELRDIFIAGEPTEDINTTPFFLSIDLSQAESRVCYMLTGDPKLITEARTNPWEFNMHENNARLIFGDRFRSKKDDPELYDLGKRGVHGAQRGMSAYKLMETLLKEDIIRLKEECEQILDAYHAAKPAVAQEYFRGIRDELWRTRKLSNTWGREIHWPYDRFDHELHKQGYSWKMQSEVAELLNQWGVVQTHYFLKSEQMKSQLVAQVHDELLLITYLPEAYKLACFIRQSLERPRTYPSGELVIPVTLKIGTTWDMKTEFKKFPSEQEFNDAAMEILNNARKAVHQTTESGS